MRETHWRTDPVGTVRRVATPVGTAAGAIVAGNPWAAPVAVPIIALVLSRSFRKRSRKPDIALPLAYASAAKQQFAVRDGSRTRHGARSCGPSVARWWAPSSGSGARRRAPSDLRAGGRPRRCKRLGRQRPQQRSLAGVRRPRPALSDRGSCARGRSSRRAAWRSALRGAPRRARAQAIGGARGRPLTRRRRSRGRPLVRGG